MLSGIVRALSAGGVLVFVECQAEDSRVPIKRLHKMSESQVRKEGPVRLQVWLNWSRRCPGSTW
ncbi:MAG: hypothetical protein ABW220_00935 [Burkholderiaceae bacterium]